MTGRGGIHFQAAISKILKEQEFRVGRINLLGGGDVDPVQQERFFINNFFIRINCDQKRKCSK